MTTPPTPPEIVGYIRVLANEHAPSAAAQRAAIEQWAAAHGCIVAAFFEDEAFARAGLRAALDCMRRRRASALIGKRASPA